jgi:predicted nucleotidyltransferase
MSGEIRSVVETAARILREAGAREVYLFGSAARGEQAEDSDIDLAVRGIPPKVFYEAIGRVVVAIGDRFDVVDLDEGGPFVDYLQRKGVLVRVA